MSWRCSAQISWRLGIRSRLLLLPPYFHEIYFALSAWLRPRFAQDDIVTLVRMGDGIVPICGRQ